MGGGGCVYLQLTKLDKRSRMGGGERGGGRAEIVFLLLFFSGSVVKCRSDVFTRLSKRITKY